MFLIAIFPIISFFYLLITGPIHTNYQQLFLSSQILKKFPILESSSITVHTTQKERGISASFMSGGATREKLEQLRKKNDSSIEKLIKDLDQLEKSDNLQSKINKNILSIKEIRKNINLGIFTTKEALKKYTSVVQSLLGLQLHLVNETNDKILTQKFLTLRLLEDAKESGGKLRANMSALFSQNKSFSLSKLQQVLDLYSGLFQGINSSGLSLSQSEAESLNNILKLKEMKEVHNLFLLLVRNSHVGSFDRDPKFFFKTISVILDDLNNLIITKRNDIKTYIFEKKSHAENVFYLSLFLCLIFSFLLLITVFAMIRSTNIQLSNVINTLSNCSSRFNLSSQNLKESANDLSSAANEQASSLEQIACSITEINSMVQRNAQFAAGSKKSSLNAITEVETSQKSVENMVSSIENIQNVVLKISETIARSNSDFNSISQLMQAIDDKTAVINDIVFQTKLLSFNASVEAARAGESGKGFAVVAEEIGKLAEMSGNASYEISSMLEDSIYQVNTIIDNSQKTNGVLVEESKKSVAIGLENANHCESNLHHIIKIVSELDQMIGDVSIASSEQAVGVEEIIKGVSSLEHVTHVNTQNAKLASGHATELNLQATVVNDSVEILNSFIGRKKAS